MNNTSNYFDFAAATPVDERVISAMQRYWSDSFYNPSAMYIDAQSARKDVNEARSVTAHFLGAKPAEIIFTAGATEANNIAIHGVMNMHSDKKVLYSTIEHDSVIAPSKKHLHASLVVDDKGRLNLDDLARKLKEDVVLVSIIIANNEIGCIQDLVKIREIINSALDERRKQGNRLPLYLHTDASQAPNYLDIHVHKLGVDLLTINGGKIYGPKQSGALYIGAHVALSSFIDGGGQERGLRSGTENVAFAVGLAESLRIAQSIRKQEAERLRQLRSQLVKGLKEVHENGDIHGHQKKCLPNIVSYYIPGIDAERLAMMLDDRGFQCAIGSACSATSDDVSHVISRGLGHSDVIARSTIRLSMGRGTTESQVSSLIAATKDCLLSKHIWQ